MGGLALFVEMWNVVPAPTLPTLALAVVVPEIGPWGILITLAALALVTALGRGWARTVATVFAALALGCALVPLFFVGGAVGAAEGAMTAALGPDYAVAAPDRERARMTARPYSLRVALTGFAPARDVRATLGLPVRLRDGGAAALDLYRPATAGAHPAVVLIYGGAWIFGKRADIADRARALAGLGYTAAVVDYRHAPRFGFPTQIDDVRDALAALARNAAAWNVDRAHVAIVGYSAGAELALLAAYRPEPLTIRAAVGYYTPANLVAGYDDPPVPDPADIRRILRAYLGTTPAKAGATYRAASPIDLVRPGLPPTLLIGGARDELVRLSQQRALRDALAFDGVRVAALELPWSNHAFDSLPNGVAGQISRYYLERFLAATL